VQNSRATSQRVLFFTPDSYTPDNVWFQSWSRPSAGGLISIVDDVPPPSRVAGDDAVYATNVLSKTVSQCRFPFTFNKKVYTSCACGGLSQVPWCPLADDVQSGQIGLCFEGAPVDSTCTQAAKDEQEISTPSALAGIIVGSLIGVVLVVLVGYAVMKRRNQQVSIYEFDCGKCIPCILLILFGRLNQPNSDTVSLQSNTGLFAAQSTSGNLAPRPRSGWSERIEHHV
jgi:hypothetical protein